MSWNQRLFAATIRTGLSRPVPERQDSVRPTASSFNDSRSTSHHHTATSGLKDGDLSASQHSVIASSLKIAPPPGVYVGISPTDPSLWSGVIFVQKGPYASAILRFQLRFPSTYPDLPPLVTFSTDIFHPLLVPLTTYTFTTGTPDTDTVSATDEERLPPGGFSLRHGFPHWFGRARRSTANSAASSRNVSGADTNEPDGRINEDQEETTPKTPVSKAVGSSVSEQSFKNLVSSPPARASPVPLGKPYASQARVEVPVLKVLNYIRSTFDDESVLDSITLEAAGNPGAWHAWRSHRRLGNKDGGDGLDNQVKRGSPQARRPGEWNWEGVWAKRVQTGIETSYLESVLFGSNSRGGSDDMIRFTKLDNDILASTKEQLISATREGSEAGSS
ncbi:hypothetical protein FQN52_008008 [Onygenales sp. PD_12]|nr:hypothetical protein FQN52_008008 [Onygenales sp. PD_12]